MTKLHVFFKKIEYLGYFLLIPIFIIFFVLVFSAKSIILSVLNLFGALFTFFVIYMRFIERNMIKINNINLNLGTKNDIKIVIISDLHLGIFKDEKFLKRVVDKINNIKNVDFVVIPGDFVYLATRSPYKLLEPLNEIKKPIYAVLGNHDNYKKEPSDKNEIIKALQKYGVILIKDKIIKYKNLVLLGIGDKITEENNLKILRKIIDKNISALIVITHNPDTVLSYKKLKKLPNLTISGHTHGGQIRLPKIYRKMIPCIGDFDKGLYELNKNAKLFISSGIGEVGFPLRFGVPPSIDVINLK